MACNERAARLPSRHAPAPSTPSRFRFQRQSPSAPVQEMNPGTLSTSGMVGREETERKLLFPLDFHGRESTGDIQERKTEKPWHRQAAILLAKNPRMDYKKVAEHIQASAASVQQLMRTSWFKAMVAEAIEENTDDIVEKLKRDALSAHTVVVEIMGNEKVKPADRLKAATVILDRAYGKPKEVVEITNKGEVIDPVAEHERLMKENNRLLQMNRMN